jgi:hypothetical protein
MTERDIEDDNAFDFVREVPGSNLGRDTHNRGWGFCRFPQFLEAKPWIMTWYNNRQFSSTSFPIHYLLIVRQVDAILSELVTASVNEHMHINILITYSLSRVCVTESKPLYDDFYSIVCLVFKGGLYFYESHARPLTLQCFTSPPFTIMLS